MMMKTLLAGAAALLSLSVHAQVSLPHTFGANEPVRGAEVNADLQTLARAVSDLQAQVERLSAVSTTAGGAAAATAAVQAPATLASLVGTYSLFGYQSEVDNGGNIQFETYTGFVTITGTGSTFSYTSNGDGASNAGGGGFKTFTETSSVSGTVSIAGSTVTLTPTGVTTGGLKFTLAHGGATMVNIQNTPNANAPSGGQDLTLLIVVKH